MSGQSKLTANWVARECHRIAFNLRRSVHRAPPKTVRVIQGLSWTESTDAEATGDEIVTITFDLDACMSLNAGLSIEALSKVVLRPAVLRALGMDAVRDGRHLLTC